MNRNERPELSLNPGWMNAAGFLGFAPANETHLPQPPVAFVTNPVSYRPRLPAADRFVAAYPGGNLLHTNWPNLGFRQVLKKYAASWARAEVPIWLHLLAEQPDELKRMVLALEETEGVSAVEISLPPTAREELIFQLVDAAMGELPLILCVPLDQVNAGWVGKCVALGVSGLVIGAPRGMIRTSSGTFSRGRMIGPGLFPQALQSLGCLRQFELPLIAGCGVYNQKSFEEFLAAGAAAVQLDGVLWRGWEMDESS